MNLLEPNSYPQQPYRWLTNQCGHFSAVGIPMGMFAVAVGLGPVLSPALVAAVYFVLWEWLAQGIEEWPDALADTSHVAAGAAFVSAALSGGLLPCFTVMVVWAAMLAVGVVRRL